MDWERNDTEEPFIAQLKGLGWAHQAGDRHDPSATGREHFGEVIQEAVLRERLRALNLRDGTPWLDEGRLAEALAPFTRPGPGRLIEVNRRATDLLREGITVEGVAGWEGGRGRTLRYIDWEHPANNRFCVASQFRVDLPGTDGRFIVADLVLLVNGLPLVVVECKHPGSVNPIAKAVEQLRRYSGMRVADGESKEGAEALFVTNQLLIATAFEQARVGCLGAEPAHFQPWRTLDGPDGEAPEETAVAASLGKERLSEQERLVAGVLEPARLLDLLRHFILFTSRGGRGVKLLARYPQYRAVNRALARLEHGPNRVEDGEHDRRGGLIWHTQGSGKSLTMVFLLRKLRERPALRRFKVIVVTDRKDLQRQLAATATLSGETVEVAGSAAALKKMVRRSGPGLIFATIQKYREEERDDAPSPDALPKVAEPTPVYHAEAPHELLNDDPAILVLVDEAHRTQAGGLHANLLAGLPNCARIGFTGTPIIMGRKKRTHAIFGDYLDRYDIRDSEADGATVPVLYEGRTARGAVKDGATLDELFVDQFHDHDEESREAIQRRYATQGVLFDAKALIADKARDMLRHYLIHLLPNGLKAQLVAYSRRAAVRYLTALEQARDELLAAAEALPEALRELDDEALCERPTSLQAEVRAWRHRELLRALEFAPVISAGENDDPAWRPWTEPATQARLIERFKRPLFPPGHPVPGAEGCDPLAFLIIKSMLLTGFDAPVEGVLYLDRPIREAELLQAVARVNRTGHGKRFGLVVDYYGVANHLCEALKEYAAEEIEGALTSIRDQLPALRDAHLRLMMLFRNAGIDSPEETEACVEALADERLRQRFEEHLKAFLTLLDALLPRPEALPYTADAKRLAYIHARARNRYKESPVLGAEVGAKVRRLIDEHVIALGVDPRVPPIQLTDTHFDDHLTRAVNDRAKASEMEHAIRAHIRQHLDEDPVRYRTLSERLDEILRQLGERWGEVVARLGELIGELREGSAEDAAIAPDLAARYHPFLRTLLAVATGGAEADEAILERAREAAVVLVDLVVEELRGNPEFWSVHKLPAQDDLRARLFEQLMMLDPPLVDPDHAEAAADRLMEQARAAHRLLVEER